MILFKNNPAKLQTATLAHWSSTRKILFRFFFIFLALQMMEWWSSLPLISYITQYYFNLVDWLVHFSNDHFFHIRKVLVPTAGSGDTSYGWANFWLYVCIAFAGCIIWSIAGRKRTNYEKLNYWLCLFVRYYIALIAFTYGILKIFALQMSFPNQSQLATPLGDFLPMRFSWMFLGYSTTYQIFSGFMETLVGFLLLYRRTTTLGVFFATAVFTNVMMLNLSYDIPVKIFSMSVVVACLFLLFNEYERMLHFFILNKPANTCCIYHFSYQKKWMRISRIIFKIIFIALAVVMPFYNNWQEYQSGVNEPESKPIKSGIYNVAMFKLNNDTVPLSFENTLRWQDVIFEKERTGSIKTSDTTFTQRYNRGYFNFTTDTINHILNFKKRQQRDSTMYSGIILSMHYNLPDSNTVQLWGKEKNDSLYVLLKRSNRHFQLAEKQFHWLSEYNR